MADNDPVVGAVLFVVDMLIRQVSWRVEPFDPATPDRDAESTAFVESAFEDLNRPFKEVVSEILSFLPHGWSYHETVFKRRLGTSALANVILGPGRSVIYQDVTDPNEIPPSKYTDGRVGWHKFAGRAQETLSRWMFDAHGEVRGMVQIAPPHYREVPIPLTKALHFRTTALRNNPEGRSILRNAYRPWYFKKTIEEIQAVGIERDLAGLPVLHVPSSVLRQSTTPENVQLRAALERMVRNIRRGAQEGVLLPSGPSGPDGKAAHEYTLELLTSAGRRQFDTKALLEYYDQKIALMALADFILMGHRDVGSFALADSKTNIFTMAIGAWLDVISDQFNDRAIPQLLRLNGLDDSRPPRLTHSDIETIDLDQLGRYIGNLAGAGMALFPNPDLEEALLNEAKLPGGLVAEL